MESWEKKLREELDSRLSEPCCEKHHKKKNKGFTDILCVGLVLISMVNVSLVYQRYYKVPVSRVVAGNSPAPAPTPAPTDDIAEIKAKMLQIVERQNSQGEKIWILAIANNENMDWLKVLDPTNSGKYLTFDRDWNLNKSPETLLIPEEDQKVLKKHLP